MNSTKNTRVLPASGFWWAIVYIALMGLGMAVMWYGFSVKYASESFPVALVLPMLVVTVFTVVALRYTGYRPQGRHSLIAVAWATPWFAVEAWGLWVLLTNTYAAVEAWITLFIVCAVTLMVGFAEEYMFRGVVLAIAARRYGVFGGMLISAVFFSLLHAVNILGGLSVGDVFQQMLNTLIFGLVLAPLAILIGRLWPLVIVHWMWDFLLLTLPGTPGGEPVLSAFDMVGQLGHWCVGLLAWIVVAIQYRRGALVLPYVR